MVCELQFEDIVKVERPESFVEESLVEKEDFFSDKYGFIFFS